MIERLSATEFRLHGLPEGMRENLDDEAYYGDPARAEAVADEQRAFLTEQGWDTYVDDAGAVQPWFPGMGYPEPTKRLTPEIEEQLAPRFWAHRIATEAAKTPEGFWLIDGGLWQDEWAATYNRAGSMDITLANRTDAIRLTLEFIPTPA